MSVDITGEKSLTVEYADGGSLTQTAKVTAFYEDNSSMDVTNSSTLTWSADSLPNGFSFNDGVLTVASKTQSGDYTIKITAEAEYGTLTKSADVTVSVTVNEPKLSALSVDITSDKNFTMSRGSSTLLAAKVSAVYEDGNSKALSPNDCSLT